MPRRSQEFLSLNDWELQLSFQAEVLTPHRRWLWQSLEVSQAHRILELGCGTGIILQELASHTTAQLYGADCDKVKLAAAASKAPGAELRLTHAESLPWPEDFFDMSYCHFFLLWSKDPIAALREACRVTRPGGIVVALAEPDYASGIEYPQGIGILELYSRILSGQGAHLNIGGNLRTLLATAGLQQINMGGVRFPHLTPAAQARQFKMQWRLRSRQLQGILSQAEILKRKRLEAQSIREGTRLLYLPVYYAWGLKP